ncbi:MAG: NAD(P)-dependent oxidoreductase, partial [Bacteroidota bacterium]
GSNGLLGQKLMHLLHQPEYKNRFEAIASSRGDNRLSEIPGLQYQSLDICNREMVKEVVGQIRPDVIINTAAMTQVDLCESEREKCWQLNVESVQHLVEDSKENDAFLVHLSTDFIFDGIDGPYPEDAPTNPLSYYGESKLASEKVLMDSEISWAIARTVLVYGITESMSRSNIILWVKKSLEAGKDIHVVTDQWRSPTLAEDLAVGCLLIAEQEAEGVFNISGKDFLTPYEIAIATADYFKLNKSLIHPTDASRFSQAAKRPPRTGFIIDKAREVLGYKPRSFEEGIALLSQQLAIYSN